MCVFFVLPRAAAFRSDRFGFVGLMTSYVEFALWVQGIKSGLKASQHRSDPAVCRL